MPADGEVWIVDDDQSVRWVLDRAMRHAELGVRTFERAEHFLEALERGRPDVLITDIRMPGMDGFEVARAMRRRIELRDTELVLVTAHREPEWATLTDQAGADDLVEKPLTAEVVGALVERAAQRVQQRVADRLARQVETPAV